MRISDWSSDVCSSDLDRDQRVVGEGQADLLQIEQFLILLDQRVLGLAQYLDQRIDVEILERRDHRQAADKFGDQAELEEILWLDLLDHLARAAFVGAGDMRAQADRLALQAVDRKSTRLKSSH